MANTSILLDIPAEHERNICGSCDIYLKKIESALHVVIIERDGTLKIMGEEIAARKAEAIITSLTELSKAGNIIDEQKVDYALELSGSHEENMLVEIDKDIICRTITGKPVKPKTIGQKKYVDLI